MARSRLSVTIQADWGGVAADITASVVSGRVEHGSGETNPDRSTIDVARGSMVLEGLDYQPGSSTRWTAAQLSTRAAVTVSHGTVTLWEGWIDQPRIIPRAARPQTRYRLVGKLDEHATRRVEAVSSSSDLYGDASLWGEITGAAPRLLGSASAGVTFAPLSWDGRGFEFSGLAALIGGRLVGEDRMGRLTMPTFGQRPATLADVGSSGLLVEGVESNVSVEQIRNRVEVVFGAPGSSRPGGALATYEWRTTNLTKENFPSADVTVDIPKPTLQPGETVENLAVSVEFARGRIPVQYRLDQVNRQPIISDVVWGTLDISSSVSATVTDTGSVYRVTIGNTAYTDRANYGWTATRLGHNPGPHALAWNGDIYRVRSVLDGFFGTDGEPAASVCVRVSYDIVVGSTHVTRRFQHLLSIAQWGDRPLDLPPWLANSGLAPGQPGAALMQGTVDHLAAPRTYHDVTLPLWQETAAKSAQVAALDYGDYVDLTLADARRGVNIDTVAVVTRRGLSWGPGRVPSVDLRLLEVTTATPVTPPPPSAAPGPPRNLALAPTETTIAASWDAPNTGGTPATYSLRYRRSGTQAWAETVTGITGRSRTVTGLTGSTTVEVEVSAVNTAGSSGWVRASATTSAPARALPIPGGLDIARDFGSLAQLSWTRVAVPGGETLRRYRTRHKAVAQEHWTEGTSSATSRYISGLQTGSQYEFQVRAEYASGDSDYSPSHQWTAGSAALPPDATRAGILTLDGAPILLDGAPITLT